MKFFQGMLMLTCLWAGGVQVSASPPFRTHVVEEGETVVSLAVRYLGDAESGDEILRFNDLTDEADVVPGFVLAIPVGVRASALSALSEAEQAVGRAGAAGADVFATRLYERASSLLESARRNRKDAIYEQATAQADLAKTLAAQAVAEADRVAPVEEPATILQVHGKVERSADDGRTWSVVGEGDRVEVTHRLRTGPEARADLGLADGSTLQIQSETEMRVATFLRDRRNELRTSRLDVLMGEILGEITPRVHSNSQFHIRSLGSVTAIRGTRLRVGADDRNTTRVSVLEGEAELGSAGSRVVLPESFGSLVRDNRPPSPPILLPAPPLVSVPGPGLTTAVQRLRLVWSPDPREGITAAYRVEIARDPEFTRIVQDQVVRDTGWVSEVLDPGNFLWRISSLTPDGLQGAPGPEGRLTIERDLEVKLGVNRPVVSHEGRSIVSPHYQFTPRPAREDTSVVDFLVRLNGGEYQSLTGPVVFRSEGVNTLRFRGVGADGALGPEGQIEVEVDATPPEIGVAISPPRRTKDDVSWFRVSLSAEDGTGVDRVEYRLNEKPFSVYVDPLEIGSYAEYTLHYRAVDVVGNVSETHSLVFPATPARRQDR
ncbi:MAG TPA: FecR domain-containing protein [Kiritimatiellia bacterium]|nr:FecR domain-containing protein [Kiritimatiellia bacterium]